MISWLAPVRLCPPDPVTPVTISWIVGVKARPTTARRKTEISPEMFFLSAMLV